jgi:hypothetical protein
VVEATADEVVLRRHLLVAQQGHGGGVRVVESEAPYCPGVDLTARLAVQGAAAFASYAGQWLELLDAALAADARSAVDVVPHNLVVDAAGKLHVIDVELVADSVTRDNVIRRGVFWLGDRVALLAPAQRWAPAETVGDLMRELGRHVGLPEDGSWLDDAVRDEVDLLAQIRPGPPVGLSEAQWRTQLTERTRARIERKLADLPFGDRLPDRLRQAQADLKDARRELAMARKQLAAARGGGSAVGRLLPRGTRRRALAERVAGRARKA